MTKINSRTGMETTVQRKHLGAALVESILILSLMVMLLVMIPSIAKRQDARQAALDANRYATWEMTVSGSTDRELLIDRFFSKPDASIRSNQTELDANLFWERHDTPLVRKNAFVEAEAQSAASVGNNRSTSLVDPRSVTLDVFERAADAGLVAKTITGTVRTVSDWTGSANAIAPDRGIVKTELSVGCAGPNSEAAVCLSNSAAILVDGWEAATDAHTKEGAQAMVPTKLLDPVGEVLDAISIVPLLKEFEDMDDSFGCVNASLLPTKELSGNISTSVGAQNEC